MHELEIQRTFASGLIVKACPAHAKKLALALDRYLWMPGFDEAISGFNR